MGGTNSVVNVGNTTIDLNEYQCSDRGLILPCKLNTRLIDQKKITRFSFIFK